ncbi:hypothetical protein FDJ25_gp180 [Vibrio phage Aphrodite1]|uniref:Uncharacterized protein n=3 Tax=Aphroditevirus TaxID=2560092 RepID=A0A2I7QI23_9CAUD|nr:hypothetical protein FDJ25_gp180 [Vibrio phage Aphrodite1]YP_009847747.1 hypothetical protein HWC35_gp011 [Vibrio phage USC-1]AUR81046.1 hypothetical protein Aphrodite1_0020 [Vibrio phage Aphrodite1]QCW23111.1 hypothetical protein [Vibrio phage 5 TSL-2019]QDH47405.1 hypothetical protein [Vibrio phage USC-1]
MTDKQIIQGRSFTFNTKTSSRIESSFDGEYGTLVIKLDDGKETNLTRRTYPKSFIDGFNGSEIWGAQQLTKILLGLFIIDPKGLINLSRSPRTCLSTLINVYREEFCIKGTFFYTDVELSMESVVISSQIEKDVRIETPNIRELTTSLLNKIMEVSNRYARKR